MKYKDHHMRHPRGHLAIKQMPKEQEVAHGATINLDAGKTPCWAGATPLFRLSSAQKVRGVAPARYTGSVTAFYSRAQREVLPKASETIFPLATQLILWATVSDECGDSFYRSQTFGCVSAYTRIGVRALRKGGNFEDESTVSAGKSETD
jgi:hypothetical protein